MLRRKEWTHDQCPRCKLPNEDTTHVWKCQDPRAKEQWASSIEKLAMWMKDQKTHPGITLTVVEYLTAWQESREAIPVMAHQFFDVHIATQNQNDIGWRAFFEGCPAKGWEEAQQEYYLWIQSKRTGLRWLSALIRKLWDLAWDMWDHRNQILHDREEGQAVKEREQRIREEFAEGSDGLDEETKLLFRPGMEMVVKYKAGPQKGWIDRVAAARRFQAESVEEADELEGE